MTNTIKKYLEKFTNWKDYGRLGTAFEMAIKEYLSGKEQKTVRSQGKKDAYFTYYENGKRKQVTIEIKTACGEIETADKSQYICYCPYVDIDIPAEEQAYMFSREDWQAFINGYTGRGKFTKLDSRGHLHIQSFYCESRPKASKPIADYIYTTCNQQLTLADWKEERRG